MAAVLCATAVGLSRRVEPASLEVDLPILLVDGRREGCPSALVRSFKGNGDDAIGSSVRAIREPFSLDNGEERGMVSHVS